MQVTFKSYSGFEREKAYDTTFLLKKYDGVVSAHHSQITLSMSEYNGETRISLANGQSFGFVKKPFDEVSKMLLDATKSEGEALDLTSFCRTTEDSRTENHRFILQENRKQEKAREAAAQNRWFRRAFRAVASLGKKDQEEPVATPQVAVAVPRPPKNS